MCVCVCVCSSIYIGLWRILLFWVFPFHLHTYNIILYNMDEEEDRILISKLNRSFSKGRNPSVKLLGGEILKYDRENKEIHMRTLFSLQNDFFFTFLRRKRFFSLITSIIQYNDLYCH